MKKILLTFALGFLAFTSHAQAKPPLLELFTSTLCPNCPAAESQISRLDANEEVFALNYHIDISSGKSYEPYATKENEARQWLYQKRKGEKYIYTPNVVVMGKENGSGAYAGLVGKMVEKAGKPERDLGIQINHTEKAGEIRIVFPETKIKNTDIWMVTYDKILRKPTHEGPSNIVRTVERIGTWKGKAARYRIGQFKENAGEYIALLIQQPNEGAIVDYVTAKR